MNDGGMKAFMTVLTDRTSCEKAHLQDYSIGRKVFR